MSKRCWSCAPAAATSRRSAPPGPRPFTTHRTRMGTEATGATRARCRRSAPTAGDTGRPMSKNRRNAISYNDNIAITAVAAASGILAAFSECVANRGHPARHRRGRSVRRPDHLARRVRALVGVDGRRRHRRDRRAPRTVRVARARHHRVHRQCLDRLEPRQSAHRPVGDRRRRRPGRAAPRMERVLLLLRAARRRRNGHDRCLGLCPAPEVRPQAHSVGRSSVSARWL